MDLNDTMHWLEPGWRCYLENKGHYIYHHSGTDLPVIKSLNHKKAKYRWVLLAGHGLGLILSKSEMSSVRQNLRQARRQNEVTYVVVGFTPEPRRVVILPAERVLKTGYVRSDIGGIDWID